MTQAAWAASRSKDNFLKARYWRLVRRIGKKKALIAVAHQILVIIWHMLTTNTPYQDLGSNWYQQQADPQRRVDYLVRQLQALGQEVSLTPAA